MKEIYIEKLITFSITHDGRYDVAIFSGEFLLRVRYYRLKIPVPAELIGETIIAEVKAADEQAAR